MHSVRLESTKMISVGTRTTYQAPGSTDVCVCVVNTAAAALVLPFVVIRAAVLRPPGAYDV